MWEGCALLGAGATFACCVTLHVTIDYCYFYCFGSILWDEDTIIENLKISRSPLTIMCHVGASSLKWIEQAEQEVRSHLISHSFWTHLDKCKKSLPTSERGFTCGDMNSNMTKAGPPGVLYCTVLAMVCTQHTIMGWVDTGHSCSSSAQCQQLLREWKCIFSPYLGCFIADLSSTRWSLWRFVVFDREPAPAAMWRFKKKLFGQVAKYLWCRIEEWWVMVIVPPSVNRMWEL